jgi:hypothetical protein
MNIVKKKVIVVTSESSRAKIGIALPRIHADIKAVHDYDRIEDQTPVVVPSLPIPDNGLSKWYQVIRDCHAGIGLPKDMFSVLLIITGGMNYLRSIDHLWLPAYRAINGDSKFRWCMNLKTGNISSAAEHRNDFLYVHVFEVECRSLNNDVFL